MEAPRLGEAPKSDEAVVLTRPEDSGGGYANYAEQVRFCCEVSIIRHHGDTPLDHDTNRHRRSKQAYKRSFKDWGFQRYLQRKDAEAMIKILRRRLREHGKKTVFKRGAALFSREQVEKCLARAKRSAADAETIGQSHIWCEQKLSISGSH